MSLEICEVSAPDKLILKESRFFMNTVQLTLEQDAEARFTKISDELYPRKKKIYFPIFKNAIFEKVSSDRQPEGLSMVFKGKFIEEDEARDIKSLLEENIAKENQYYEQYKKDLDIELSAIINDMSGEIARQKKFLEADNLTRSGYSHNIKTLIDAYTDAISARLNKDINLGSDDLNEVKMFYSNMIAGIYETSIDRGI